MDGGLSLSESSTSNASIKARVTKRLVDAARPPARGEARIWDTDIRGFVVRVYASGAKVYSLKYRRGSRQRWYRIGVHGSPWTPETARDEARKILSEIHEGADPQEERLIDRKAMTVADMIDLYVTEGPKDRPNKRESSWRRDRMDLNNHVRPLLGRMAAQELSPKIVARFQSDVREGKTARDRRLGPRSRAIVRGGDGAALRAVMSLSAMLGWAVRRELVTDNPVLKIEKIQQRAHERFLSPQEIDRLFRAIDALKGDGRLFEAFGDIIELLLETGARRTEIAELRWTEVDLDRRLIMLPPHRTKVGGRNRMRAIALSDTACALLARRERRGELVFQSFLGDQPLQGLSKAWERVRAHAGLSDVRLHDLRHTFASMALQGGAPLAIVGRALGHRNASSTERYAHLRDEAAFAAVEVVSKRIREARG